MNVKQRVVLFVVILLAVLGVAMTAAGLFFSRQRKAALKVEMAAIKSTVIYGKTLQDFRHQQEEVLSRAYAVQDKLEPDTPEMKEWETYIELVRTGWAKQIKRGRRTKERPQR